MPASLGDSVLLANTNDETHLLGNTSNNNPTPNGSLDPSRPSIVLVPSQYGTFTTFPRIPQELPQKTSQETPSQEPDGFVEEPVPTNSNAVVVRGREDEGGLGVFARRGFAAGHIIIEEKPAWTSVLARHSDEDSQAKEFAWRWCICSLRRQDLLKLHFPELMCIPTGRQISESHGRHLLSVARKYAFSNPQKTQVLLYLIASHITHACRSCANAVIGISKDAPQKISIMLRTNIKEGDEILIAHNRPAGELVMCPRCGLLTGRRSWLKRVGHRLARLCSGIQPFWNQHHPFAFAPAVTMAPSRELLINTRPPQIQDTWPEFSSTQVDDAV